MKTLNDNNPSGNPLPTDKEFYDQDFNTTLQAEMFDNGPESPDEELGDKAVKGVAWLGAIVGIFALAILICAAFNLSPTPSPAKPYPVKTAMQKTFLSSQSSSSNSVVSNRNYSADFSNFEDKPVILKSITIIAQEPAQASAANIKAPTPSTVSIQTQSASMTKAYQDRIEKEALEVIHGDFGNNPGRAEKLGPDYAAVQARVNQLMHS